ncbi:MAG TPA: pilus assembly protein PilM, partial [Pirellulaceae bacterium]|nr:pilus assembly protein PilM [Pirellulaceae bacterium]
CSKIFRLAEAAANATATRFPAIVWKTPPARPHIGCPIDWLGGSERLNMSSEGVAASWQSEPGRYFVAAGLALQAIDVATANTNLHKAEKQGLLGQLSIGKRKEVIKRGWGVDIGASSLKVVRLTSGPGSAEPVVDCCDLIPHRVVLSRPEAEASRSKLLAESLSTFLAKYPVDKSDRVCVSFPGHKTLGRTLQLPNAAPKKLAEMIQFEAKSRIPIPLDELAFSYHAFATSADNAESVELSNLANTLLIAAKRRDVEELLMVFDELQFPVNLVQSDAVALFNFAAYEGLGELTQQRTGEVPSIALIDIGTVATNMVILTNDRPWFRSFRHGGDDYTNAAVQRLNLTLDQAEQVKLEPTRVRRLNELYEAFDPMFSRLTDEIQRSLESFHKETGRRVAHVLGVGGGFRLHGLLKYLRNGP